MEPAGISAIVFTVGIIVMVVAVLVREARREQRARAPHTLAITAKSLPPRAPELQELAVRIAAMLRDEKYPENDIRIFLDALAARAARDLVPPSEAS